MKKEKMNTAIMYADDLCCFAASAGGLQDLLDVCSNYAKLHEIVFNCEKTVDMTFSLKICTRLCLEI